MSIKLSLIQEVLLTDRQEISHRRLVDRSEGTKNESRSKK